MWFKGLRLRGQLLPTALSSSPDRLINAAQPWALGCGWAYPQWKRLLLWLVRSDTLGCPLYLQLSNRRQRICATMDWFLKLFMIEFRLPLVCCFCSWAGFCCCWSSASSLLWSDQSTFSHVLRIFLSNCELGWMSSAWLSFLSSWFPACTLQVEKVCSSSGEENLQPFKGKMDAFLTQGKHLRKMFQLFSEQLHYKLLMIHRNSFKCSFYWCRTRLH